MGRSTRLFVTVATCWCAVTGAGRLARAATNPTSAIVRIECGVLTAAAAADRYECGKLKFTDNGPVKNIALDGWLEFLSGGLVVATENNPIVLSEPGSQGAVKSIDLLLTGGGNVPTFQALYLNPMTSIFNAPDLQVRIWVNDKNNPPQLGLLQNFAPQAASLWAAHSGDTAGLEAANQQLTAAIAAEVAARTAGDAVLTASVQGVATSVAHEQDVRAAADNALSQGLTNEANRAMAAEAFLQLQVNNANNGLQGVLNAEIAARLAADAALQNGLNAEVAARTAADVALQNALSNEAVARAAGDANEAAARTAADAAELVRAMAAEATLAANLNDAIAHAIATENALTTSIDNEIARAIAAESTLTTNLTNEITRATAAETTLTANLNNEIARAIAAEGLKANVTLNNLSNVAINSSLLAGSADSLDLGSGAKTWRTLFLTNNAGEAAGVNFQPSGGGVHTLLAAAPASVARTITLPDASGTVAVSASGNIALDGAGHITFSGVLPIASGGTNNASFSNGKFVAFDGSKLASTDFDTSSFAAANASITVTAGAGLSGGGNVALGGSVTLANSGVTALAAGGGITVSRAIGAVTIGSAAGGDLSGSLDAAMVTGLRGHAVANIAPGAGQVLTWDGASWAPADVPGGGGGGGGGGVTGGGLVNTITKWTGATTVGNSGLADNGSTISTSEALSASALGMGPDYRTNWNGQNANSVNPMPRTCAVGQIAVATGPYQWQCATNCPLGAIDCDANANNGCEVFAATDVNNCGGCGFVCSGNHIAALSCSNGFCNGACNAGFADCNSNKLADGCEAGIATDPNNCGSCATICSSNHMASRTCGGGVCNGACAAGFADCNSNKQTDGCESSVAADPNNCGGCAFVCSNLNMQTRTCGGGSCNGSCNGGFADCNNNKLADGCEANVNTDVTNCGGCGVQCSTNNINRACGGGSCNAGSCNAGFADCNSNKQADGCEINITNNVSNCGACGNVCPNVPNGTRACSGSSCVIAACNANFYNVNGSYGDGCECNAPGLNSCGVADNLGQMGWGGNSVFGGTIPGGSGEHWYTINFANSGAAYHPHILVAGGGYTLDVFTGCGGAQLNCDEGGTSTGRTNWEVNQTAGDPGSGCGCFTWSTPSPGTQLWIRVRAVANTGCSGYTVNFRNDGG